VLVFKSVVWFFVAPGSVLAAAPWGMVEWGPAPFDPGPWRWLGVAPLVLGLVAVALCFADFIRVGRGTPIPIDAPKRLVVRGLYRRVRNPMYAALLFSLVGEALLLGEAAVLLWAAAIGLIFHLFVVFHEEPRLRRLFGREYEDYVRAVPRWIPRLRAA
jgi:protein-S-isoprenylcysteine O-methyltransferase Ste14